MTLQQPWGLTKISPHIALIPLSLYQTKEHVHGKN